MNRIPYEKLASGIAHGPYKAAPVWLMRRYTEGHLRAIIDPSISDEQLRADIESEWQYDQHCRAIVDAEEVGPQRGGITPEHSIYMQERVLRPWFIGWRNPGE